MNMLKAAQIFQDYCILQRRKPIHIWGISGVNHLILVTSGNHSVVCCSNDHGNWEAYLPSMEAVLDTKLKITDLDSGDFLLYSHISIGEVWIAGGQSNMEFLMRYDDDRYRELYENSNPNIRYFEVPHRAFLNDSLDNSSSGQWRICDKANLEYFSAVGYYFAKDLESSLQIPVGIVSCNWGGTSALTWIPQSWIQVKIELQQYWQDYQFAVNDLNLDQYQQDFGKTREKQNYLAKHSHQQIQHWICREDQLKFVQDHALEDYGLVPALPMGPWHQNSPGRLYESMLLTISGMTMRGVIWYQGESDVERAEQYDVLFRNVIESWRSLWGEEFPWLFVQLAPFYKWLDQDGRLFPLIRQKQELVSKTIPNTWMASIMDCGSKWGIHPTRKKYVGIRLSLLARGKVYGESILCDAPECISAVQNGCTIILTFIHAGRGMELHDEIQHDLYVHVGSKTMEIISLSCKEDMVIITIDSDAEKADAVEFLNVPYSEDMLYNSAGLPAKPFVIPVNHCITCSLVP